MTSPRDEAIFWQTKASDAHHNLLDNIQSSAGKWQGAIAAFLGVYTTAGFILGPDKLASLPVHGDLENLTVVVYCVAGVAGIIALVLANLAAQGIPQIMTGELITGPRMYNLVSARARKARCYLMLSIIFAGSAGALILLISGFLLWAGIHAQNNAVNMDILIKPTVSVCGQLKNQGGEVGVIPSGGTFTSAAGGSLTPVGSCP